MKDQLKKYALPLLYIGAILAFGVIMPLSHRRGQVQQEETLPTACDAEASAMETEAGHSWAVFFSPNGGAEDAIVHEIGIAKKTIRMQSYSFTSQPIAEALLQAANRGVDVEIIMDDSNSTNPLACRMAKELPVYLDGKHSIAHMKAMVFDGKKVRTGSMNFSRAGDCLNCEDTLILTDKQLAKVYLENYEKHKSHSQRMK